VQLFPIALKGLRSLPRHVSCSDLLGIWGLAQSQRQQQVSANSLARLEDAAALALVGAHWAINTLFTCAPAVARTLRLGGDAGICMDMALGLSSTALSTLADGLDYGLNFDPKQPPIALGGEALSAISAVGHVGLISTVVQASDAGSLLPPLFLDYISDEYGLRTTVQALLPAAPKTMAAGA
jgi:hypothetical protein